MLVRIISCIIAAFIIIGCGGGASSNDQGTTVTFLGFFATSGAATGVQLPVQQPGVSYPITGLSTENPLIPTNSENEGQIGDSENGVASSVTTYVGLQNQSVFGVNLRGVHLSYEIPGAEVSIPDTTYTIGGLLGPAPLSTTGPAAPVTSLPPSFFGLANRIFPFIQVVTPEILRFLAFNLEFLPEPPFNMIVRVAVRYTTTAGDAGETESYFTVTFAPGVSINPSAGGSGGDEAAVEEAAS